MGRFAYPGMSHVVGSHTLHDKDMVHGKDVRSFPLSPFIDWWSICITWNWGTLRVTCQYFSGSLVQPHWMFNYELGHCQPDNKRHKHKLIFLLLSLFNPQFMHICWFNVDALAQGIAYKPTKKLINHSGPANMRIYSPIYRHLRSS